jgi:hypothetical protein
MATIWALLIYWLVIFVGCYVVIEIGQDQLYDEVTPHVGLKVTGGSLLLALMLAGFYYKGMATSFDSMFTNNILCTVFQALVWFGVFVLIFQFHRDDAPGPGPGHDGRQQHPQPHSRRGLPTRRLCREQARPPVPGPCPAGAAGWQ